MSFSFSSSDRDIGEALRRIAAEQFEKAARDAADTKLTPERAIHSVRRRCKKLRGLVRLVRPNLKSYAFENAAIRDAAAALSANRDAAVMIETLDALAQSDEQAEDKALISAASYGALREAFLGRMRDSDVGSTDAALLASFAQKMLDGLKRSRQWHLKRHDFEALEDGLVETYRAMRKAMVTAEAKPSDDAFHEWRKHVKYHWHHVGLLRRTSPDLLEARRTMANTLAEALGDHHNLSVLVDLLQSETDTMGGHGVTGQVVLAARHRQRQLEGEAFALGEQLAAEKPKALGARFAHYWSHRT